MVGVRLLIKKGVFMEFKKSLLMLTCIFAMAQVFADDAEVKGTKKCLNVRNLNVCNNATIAGSLAVAGSETVGGSLSVNGTLSVGGAQINPGKTLGYGFAYDTSGSTVSYQAFVPFSNVNNPSSGVTLPTAGGTTFTVQSTGIYQITYNLAAVPNVAFVPPAAVAVICCVVDVNTAEIFNGSVFAGVCLFETLTLPAFLGGTFLASLTAGQQIAIQNLSDPFFLALFTGFTGATSNDATFVIEQIA